MIFGTMQFDDDSLLLTLIPFLITTLIAYYFYKKSNREKIPQIRIHNANLINEEHKIFGGDLKLKFKGKGKIHNFSVARIIFWNDGREIINRSDIVDNYIKILPKDNVKLLNAKILYQSNSSINSPEISPNKFHYEFDKDLKNILISFEYIAQYEGVALEVQHTGISETDIVHDGTIKGVKLSWDVKPSILAKYFNMFFSFILEKNPSPLKKCRFISNLNSVFFLYMVSCLYFIYNDQLKTIFFEESFLGFFFTNINNIDRK